MRQYSEFEIKPSAQRHLEQEKRREKEGEKRRGVRSEQHLKEHSSILCPSHTYKKLRASRGRANAELEKARRLSLSAALCDNHIEFGIPTVSFLLLSYQKRDSHAAVFGVPVLLCGDQIKINSKFS
ncbi:Hypothetical predicted protein [Cloeon dipterum]|uniref:Uncharacterized protein n=1 Tax=Cloeon dipterum TaxID=197152 RepID=A0A8S1CNL1_9INSE|nr:Hypothetical predicted protein [Cloeon dipterum]